MALTGIQTRGGPSLPYDWRVFVDDSDSLTEWLASLGADAKAVRIPDAEADFFKGCELGRLYPWGGAPVCRPSAWRCAAPAGAPMWHPRDRRPPTSE